MHSYIKPYFLTFLLSIGCLSMPSVVAQESSQEILRFNVEQDILTMPVDISARSLIVSATGKFEETKELAVQANVLSAAKLIDYGVLTVEEGLGMIPGLMVRPKLNGTYDVVMMGKQGLNGPQTVGDLGGQGYLLLKDGMPLMDRVYNRPRWEEVPVNLSQIERIEVVFNPATITYGEGAVLGIIQIISKKHNSSKLHFDGSVQAGNSSSVNTRVNASWGVKDRVYFKSGYSHTYTERFNDSSYIKSQGTYRPNNELLFYEPNAYYTNPYPFIAKNHHVLDLGSNIVISENRDISIDYAYVRSQYQDIYQAPSNVALSYNDTKMHYFNLNGLWDKFRYQLSYQSGERSVGGRIGGVQQVGYLNGRGEYLTKLMKGDLILGVHLQQENIDISTNNEFIRYLNLPHNAYLKWYENRNPYTEGNKTVVGLYAKNSHEFERWAFNYGVRMDYAADLSNHLMPTAELQTKYKLTESANLWMNVANSYRLSPYGMNQYHTASLSPIYDPSSKGTGEMDTITYVSNPDLAPQTSQSLKIGYRNTFIQVISFSLTYGLSNANNEWRAQEINHQEDENEVGQLIAQPEKGEQYIIQYQNFGGQVRNQSLTVEIDYLPNNRFNAHVWATYQKGSTAGVQTYGMPSCMGGVNGSFRFLYNRMFVQSSLNFQTGYDVNLISSREAYFAGAQHFEIPFSYQWQMGLNYQLAKFATVFVNVKNLLPNQHGFYPMADRTATQYMFGLNLKL
ncbi:TonB-dependent receptor [Persicobacter psychrovividus]|uniref:TonB-dependent receptor plug domain-containing protein n=1 Tax=Persicobacter psychrovividus TaxID=387638 RepID=A0ABM7VMI9_9BACT|nr:hypothetical protein PEPS_45100 [Persicobacter psychrovividus]